jgi:uncharacterized protein (DUF1697 family)
MPSAKGTRYAAILRGVMPTNAKMPELKRAFELAGFTDVKTVLGSGNVVFTVSGAKAEAAIEKKAEAAMKKHLGSAFFTIVRSVDDLRALLESKPYARMKLDPKARKVITFMRKEPAEGVKLPIEQDGAVIVKRVGREAFSAYVTGPKGPVFMRLIEKTFGKDVTTRTWETVEKLAK